MLFNDDFSTNITRGFNKSQSINAAQVFIHSTDGSTEYAIHWNIQRSSFSIHGTTTAYNKIRMPDDIQAIIYLFRDDQVFFFDKAIILFLNLLFLILTPWQNYHTDCVIFRKVIYNSCEYFFTFGVMVVGFGCGRPNHY